MVGPDWNSAADPLLLGLRAVEHGLAEIQPEHVCVRWKLCSQRECDISAAGCQIHNRCRTFLDDAPDLVPPPPPVYAQTEHMVGQVITWRDAAEHVVDGGGVRHGEMSTSRVPQRGQTLNPALACTIARNDPCCDVAEHVVNGGGSPKGSNLESRIGMHDCKE